MTITNNYQRIVFLFLITVISGGLLIHGDAVSAAEPIRVKFNYPGPQSPPSMHPLSQAIGLFGKKLEENSQGRFKVEIFWNASLYKDNAEQYEALKADTIQMCEVSGGRLGNEIPETYLMELPFIFDNMNHVYSFLLGSGKKLFEPLYLKKGYKLMGFWPYGFQNFVCRKGFLAKPDDFTDVKLRIRPSKIVEAQMKALGAEAKAIPYMETYDALKNKVVDGAECPLSVIHAVKWHETGDYITISEHSLLFAAMLVNPKFYNGLPADLRKIFDDTFREVTDFELKTQEELEKKMEGIMQAERPALKFKRLTDAERNVLKKRCKPVWNQYGEMIPKEFFDAVVNEAL